MKKNWLIYSGFLLIVLVLVGCSRWGALPVAEDQPAAPVNGQTNQMIDQEAVGGINFTSYTNRSMGYTIVRPERWYWRHYIKSQIGSNQAQVEDYFITSPKPLPGLDASVLGQIVIEATVQDLNELSTRLSTFTKNDVEVGGVKGTRYEGTKKDSQGRDLKVVEYQIKGDKESFRFIYTQGQDDQDNLAVFEKIVQSFKFGL